MDEPQSPADRPDPAPTWSPYGAPAPLVAATGLVVVEALVLGGYGIAELFHLNADRAVMGVTTAGFFLIAAVGLVVCAWALNRVLSWGRGPVMLAQLIALGLAYNFGSGGTWAVAVALAVPAVIVLAGMLHPATIEALENGRDL